jgi:hypothetical protein
MALRRFLGRFLSLAVAPEIIQHVTFLATELTADAAPGGGMLFRCRDLYRGDWAFERRVHHETAPDQKLGLGY